MPKEIQMIKVDSEKISPEAYLKLSAQEKLNVSYVKIVPPQLGKKGFGKIQLVYKNPVFRVSK